jgi:hypothetical protein
MDKWMRNLEAWLNDPARWSAGLRVLGFVFLCAGLLYYFRDEFVSQPATGPCTPTEYPARCYHLNANVCKMMWAHSESICQEHVQQMHLPPGRPHGPTLTQCTLALFDQAFPYSRRGTLECEERHRDLESWRKQNLESK